MGKGGNFAAQKKTTGGDITNYFEVIPSNYLQTLLWAEAERLTGVKLTVGLLHSLSWRTALLKY